MDAPGPSIPVLNDASKGLVTSRDPFALAPGELAVATGCEYHVGSPHLYKLPGRLTTNNDLGGVVLSVVKAQYDSGDDVLIGDANGQIWESAVSTAPVFSAVSGIADLSTTVPPQYTGFKNEWIRTNGVDDNMIREALPVPGGTMGNWRTLGLATALIPSLASITHYTGGGLTVRPTSSQDPPHLPYDGLVSYHDPQFAYDGPGFGTGTVSGAAGQNVVIGVGTYFTTELSEGANLTFATGELGVVQTIITATKLLLVSNLNTILASSTFTYTNSTTSTPPEETRAWAATSDAPHIVNGTSSTPLFPRYAYCTWYFSTNLAGTGRTLSVLHHGSCSPPNLRPNFGPTGMTFKIEYSINNGSTWTTVSERHQPFTNAITDTYILPDDFNMAGNLAVRATCIANTYQRVSGHWLDVSHSVLDIKVSTGASGVYNAANALYYGVSEVYTDSDGVEHQSNMGVQVGNGGEAAGLYISAADLQAATSVTITLPAQINPLATEFIIWRSVDTPGGGYPVMYAVGRVPITDTVWTDTFSTRPDDTGAIALLEQYKILEILYSTGESSFASYYTQPPLSFMTLVFQGCVVYFPSEEVNARRIFYSLPATVSSNALEQVPEQYYLDFQTPKNDQVKSGAITNGGRSMLAFFENYTMLVNYLPQGADPGGFNNSVKEYVSNVRGCAGRLACAEFTLPSGQTLVGAVDGLGLWITNGVNMVEEWSTDIDWDAAFADVDLSTIELVDKPHKRRLELLYEDADGHRQEYHFFYGRMKAGLEGKALPLVTGPHPTGTRCKHYNIIEGKWMGFGGDASTTGDVFLEDAQAADDSHGYDNTGIVPWIFTLADIYIGNISRAHIVESANIKFADTPVKDFQIIGTFIRDSGITYSLTKTIRGDHTAFPKNIYWHAYGDRHHITFTDITNTEAPEFIQYALKVRQAGGARDR